MAAPSSSKAAAAAASQGLSMGGKVFFGGLCVGTFGLGVWQIDRFFQKIQKMEARSMELAMEPTTSLDNNSNNSGTAGQSYRRRHLQGVWRHDREVLVGPRGAPPGVQMPLQGLSAAKKGSSSTTTASGMAPGPQGYHVLTPLKLSPGTADRDMVWVNRGWVPKRLVPGAEGQYRSGRGGGPLSVAEEAAQWSSYPAWNREEGLVNVTAVHSKVEKPRYMTPQHDYSKRPLQLFWLDGLALQAISESNEEAMLMVQVDDKDDDDTNNIKNEKTNSTSTSSIYPLRPPVEAIATFKTTPSIHAGYAATWFGLSASGLYMTRKLISKGRF